MDKREFYDQLHEEISKKLGIPIVAIGWIRDFYFREKMQKEKMIKFLSDDLLKRPRHNGEHKRLKTRRHSLKFYQNLLAFLSICTEDQWRTLTEERYFLYA